jgi:ATP-dependent DNA helicase 2 subunit 2
VSALLVALDMIRQHKHGKSWTLEVILVTDGEGEFEQEEYDQAMDVLDNLGIRFQVV